MNVALGPHDAERDAAAHRTLFELSFPETVGEPAGTDRHYRWKFRGFPAAPPAYEWAARDDDGKLLGYYAALPYRYRVAGREVVVGMACDVMTHPDARGQGIFTKMGRYATDDLRAQGFGFTTGYPIRPEVIPGHLKAGWRKVVQLPMYLRPVSARGKLPGAAAALAPAIDAALGLGHALVERLGTDAGYRVAASGVEELLAQPDYAPFLARAQRPTTNVLVRSPEFMRWRLSAPGTSYTVFQALRGTRLGAYAVTREVELRGIATVAILDLVADDRTALRPLHRAILAHARASGANAIVAMASRRAAARLGFGLRFVPTPYVFTLIVKRLDDRLPAAIDDANAWEPMWIDSDDL